MNPTPALRFIPVRYETKHGESPLFFISTSHLWQDVSLHLLSGSRPSFTVEFWARHRTPLRYRLLLTFCCDLHSGHPSCSASAVQAAVFCLFLTLHTKN